ncbi:hypothetical protein Nepgr_033591 [Nepenthes gracilis]|uniref:Uncharacterized protein n=1 Tax=Nepenthes gracilis TaxID=150966 RepID=A0AAD3TLQ8_NEPGR|nr:hypothetical protein Nepgr_033591 [Nepenthes gracilis]
MLFFLGEWTPSLKDVRFLHFYCNGLFGSAIWLVLPVHCDCAEPNAGPLWANLCGSAACCSAFCCWLAAVVAVTDGDVFFGAHWNALWLLWCGELWDLMSSSLAVSANVRASLDTGGLSDDPPPRWQPDPVDMGDSRPINQVILPSQLGTDDTLGRFAFNRYRIPVSVFEASGFMLFLFLAACSSNANAVLVGWRIIGIVVDHIFVGGKSDSAPVQLMVQPLLGWILGLPSWSFCSSYALHHPAGSGKFLDGGSAMVAVSDCAVVFLCDNEEEAAHPVESKAHDSYGEPLQWSIILQITSIGVGTNSRLHGTHPLRSKKKIAIITAYDLPPKKHQLSQSPSALSSKRRLIDGAQLTDLHRDIASTGIVASLHSHLIPQHTGRENQHFDL